MFTHTALPSATHFTQHHAGSRAALLSVLLLICMPLFPQQNPTPTQTAQPATPGSLDDDPVFKKLSPEMQERVRQFMSDLNEALANDKNAPAKETTAKQPDPSLKYTYAQAAPANNPPPPAAQPAKPPVPSPCAVPPKKPGFFAKLKKHAEQTLENQAGKADAQIAKGSGGNVDAGVQDTTTTAVNQANQSDPCTPAKGQPAKQ